MRVSSRVMLASILVLLMPTVAIADVIWVGTGTGRGLRQDVDIIGIEGNELIYNLFGNRTSVQLARVQQMEVNGERGFNAAEEAFVSGDWERAASEYAPIARQHQREWMRRRAAERLILAAERAGRFDEAVTGYVQLTLLAPGAAVGREPRLRSDLAPEQLATAARQVEQALNQRLDPSQERALAAFALNLHNLRDDEEAAGRVVERLARLVGDDPGDDPQLFAQVTLGRANLALSRDRLDEAQQLIERHGRVFTEPATQSEALLLLARVAEQRARAEGGRRDAMLDAALAYMRVVAHFKQYDELSAVPEALLRIGMIHEELDLREEAAGVYQDLVARYPASPAAETARQRLAALEQPR